MALEHILSIAEAQTQEAADALLGARPLDLVQCSALLREAATGLARTLEQQQRGARRLPAHLAQRVRALNERLALVREQLARVSALNDRQTAALLPPVEVNTYGSARPNAYSLAPRIYYATT